MRNGSAGGAGRWAGVLSTEGREVALFLDELVRTTRATERSRELDARRRARVAQVLEAASHTRFYGPHLDAAAIREGRIDAVPPVTKTAFLERLGDTFVDPTLQKTDVLSFVRDPARAGHLLHDRYVLAVTSGTTGQVGVFVNDVESWAKTRATTFARIFGAKLNAKDIGRALGRGRTRLAFIVATGGHFMTAMLASRVPPLGRAFVDADVLSIEMPLPAIAARLAKKPPHVLHTYPTVLELLAAERVAGRLDIDPDVITVGSEPFTPSCKDAVQRAFPRALIVETYAATECVQMATSCALGTLHVNEDAALLEPVDAHNRPVKTGEVSERVLVTNLLNLAQPLVRYVLTDQIEPLSGGCACGSPRAAIRVHGRSDDTFVLAAPDGSWQAHPPIPLEIVFLSVPGLRQYQLIHERQNVLRVLFVVEPGAHGAQVAGVLDEKITRYLSEHGLVESVTFGIEQVGNIERTGDGKKMRQILSRVPRSSAAATTSAAAVRERRHRPREGA